MVTRVLFLLAMVLGARASVWSVTNDVASISTQAVVASAGEVRITVAARSGGLPVDLTNTTSQWAIVDARDLEAVTNASGRTLDATSGLVRFSAVLPVGSFRATAAVFPAVDPSFTIDATALTVTSPFPAVVEFITQNNTMTLPSGIVTNGATNITLQGTFSGDGSALTGVYAAESEMPFLEISTTNSSTMPSIGTWYTLPFSTISQTSGTATAWTLTTNALTIRTNGLFRMSGAWSMIYAGTSSRMYSYLRYWMVSGSTTSTAYLFVGDPPRTQDGIGRVPLIERWFRIYGTNSATIYFQVIDFGHRLTNDVGSVINITRCSP